MRTMSTSLLILIIIHIKFHKRIYKQKFFIDFLESTHKFKLNYEIDKKKFIQKNLLGKSNK